MRGLTYKSLSKERERKRERGGVRRASTNDGQLLITAESE
jgi:hypothetical protein